MAFSLGKLFKQIQNVGPKADSSVLGIDIGASSAKIVQLRASRGIAVLETYGEISLGPYGNQPIGKTVKLPPEKTAEAITDLMKEANITARTGGVSIPFSGSLVSVLDLPNVDEEQLKRIVPIEARKYIPVPVSEVSLDWFIIPKEEGDQSAFDQLQDKAPVRAKGQEVFLVAIHNDLLHQYQTMAATAGLSVSFFE